MTLLQKIEEKYGMFVLLLFVLCGGMISIFAFAVWVFMVVHYIWPALIPVAIMAWIVWGVRK